LRKQRTSHQSMMAKVHFDTLGFSADHTKKPFKRIRTSRDSKIQVTYSAPVTCGIKEMKCVYALVRECISDNSRYLKPDGEEKYKVHVDLRDMARLITNRTTISERKGIFESLVRVANMSIRVLINDTKELRTQWLYDIATTDNYETAHVVVSKTFIKTIKKSGIGYNLGHLMQYHGRSALLYAFMQGYKYNVGNGKFAYQHYIPHQPLVEAVDLDDYNSPREQIKQIKKAFSSIGLNYFFKKNEVRWEKGKVK